jgi:hypothetical protein
MMGITAWRIVACMANLKAICDRSIVKGICAAMRSNILPLVPYYAITSRVFIALPSPTLIRFANMDLSPKAIGDRNDMKAHPMSVYIAMRTALDYSSSPICMVTNRRNLTTPTLTKVGGVKAELDGFWYTFHCRIPPLKVFDHAEGCLLQRLGF